MVFSSTVFLYAFLPIVLSVYYILFFVRKELSNYWLLVASLVFYAWNKPEFILLLLASIAINYVAACLLGPAPEPAAKGKKKSAEPDRGRRRTIVMAAVALNLLLLFYFKYFTFVLTVINDLNSGGVTIPEIILPIGISFFTFQGMSYVIDVGRGEVEPQKNPLKLAMYISMFPQLVAGPIVRYRDIAQEIDNRSITLRDVSDGISRFIFGLFKKVIIADSLAVIADQIFGMAAQYRPAYTAWIGIAAYTLQIFFDFSGYSDMAIGMGRMMGFHFKENFNYPYISDNISEFWRRWHISLSSFFRDYVYIPLGGNRRHVYLNLAIVFLLTGIWHGAAFTFIVWGLWHGFFVLAERLLRNPKDKAPKGKDIGFSVLSHVYTMIVVMVGWVFFRAQDMPAAMDYIKSMLGGFSGVQAIYAPGWFFTRWNILVFVLALALSTEWPEKLMNTLKSKLGEKLWPPVKYVGLLLLLFECTLRVVSDTYSAFIYFQF